MAKIILPILSGILLILAYPPFNLGFLIWVALIPLFWFIASKSASNKQIFWGGTLCGIVFFGKLFSWIFATAPFEWLGIATEKETIFVFVLLAILYIAQTVFLGLFLGVFAYCLRRSFAECLKLRFKHLITIPALWIVFEYLRAWGFGILWLGKESLLGPHWTFGNLAYALHNNLALIQIADTAGIYGISLLIVFVNTALFLILKKCGKSSIPHKQVIILFILLATIGTLWSSYGIYKLEADVGFRKPNIEISQPAAGPPQAKKIALLQTNFLSESGLNPYQKKEVFKTVLSLLKSPKARSENSDFIIAPEGFGIISLTGDKEIAKYLIKDFWQSGQIYLENEKVINEKGEVRARLFYYDLEKEEPLAFHDKMLLVPNGEFLPYLTQALLSIYSFDINYGQEFYERGENVRVAQAPKGNIGGTICSSILSPELQRQMTKQGAEFLVVVSSDAPFHGSKALLAQNLAMSKLRAVENRRYFAQATNMGHSFLLNPKGEIVVRAPGLGNEILFANIYLLNKKTIYTRFGDWIIILSTIIVLLLTANLWYNQTRLQKYKKLQMYKK